MPLAARKSKTVAVDRAKQRSINLNDATYALITQNAERMGVTNSSFLSQHLHATLGEDHPKAIVKNLREAAAPLLRGARDIVLPPDGQENFPVKNDPNNGAGSARPTAGADLDQD